MKKKSITAEIYTLAFKILESRTEGIRWADMLREIRKHNPSLHPKTVNGCVWKLTEKYPDRVYKPAKGVFRLAKYRSFK